MTVDAVKTIVLAHPLSGRLPGGETLNLDSHVLWELSGGR